MAFMVLAGIRVLEALFVLGWVGTVLVLILTSIEDVSTVVKEKPDLESMSVSVPLTMIDRSDVTA